MILLGVCDVVRLLHYETWVVFLVFADAKIRSLKLILDILMNNIHEGLWHHALTSYHFQVVCPITVTGYIYSESFIFRQANSSNIFLA